MTSESAVVDPARNTTNSNDGSGRSGRNNRGGRGGHGTRHTNGGRGKGHQQRTTNIVPEFTGMCKKDLVKHVIIYSENRAIMAGQWIRFDNAVYNAAGKADPKLAKSISLRKLLTLGDFLPEPSNPSEYTISINIIDGKSVPVYDVAKKKLYDKASDLMVNKAVDAYELYKKNWEIFFFRIKGQVDPETMTRVEMSNEWEMIKSNTDAGGLMKLIHKVCMHGTDREYLPERIINSMITLLITKQGKHSPADFSETTLSNNEVLTDIAGHSVFAHLPALQKFVIDKYEDLTFDVTSLNKQSEKTKALLYKRCDECILGCNMTLRSNKDRSDMNEEVHKSLLSKHGSAFAMTTSEAVDQMVGFEQLKRRSNNSARKTAGGGDSSSALVMMGIADNNPADNTETGDGFRCYHCGKPGHSQYKCPDLTVAQRQALYQKDKAARTNRTGSSNPIESAVMIHLGGDLDADDENSIKSKEDESTLKYEEDEAVDAFIFCEIEVDDDEHDERFNKDEFNKMLNNVAIVQRKNNPEAWANAVAFKLSTIEISNVVQLHYAMPTINSQLRSAGQSAFHNTTLRGFKSEIEQLVIPPNFRQGRV